MPPHPLTLATSPAHPCGSAWQEEADAIRKKIIDDERRRILEAHAKNLDLKHLPKGVLATDEDFAIFGGEKKKAYSTGRSVF